MTPVTATKVLHRALQKYAFDLKPAAPAGQPKPATPAATPRPNPNPFGGAVNPGANRNPFGAAAAPPRRPAPATPAPVAQYRGQNEMGAVANTPTRAPYMKTWQQLNQEQNINSADTAPRKGFGDMAVDGITGAVLGVGAAGLNLAGTVVGRPATYLYDKATGSNTNEWMNDALAQTQDIRDRGLHQFLYSGRSNALSDRLDANTANINEFGTPTQQRVNNTAQAASGALPYTVGPAALGTGLFLGQDAANIATQPANVPAPTDPVARVNSGYFDPETKSVVPPQAPAQVAQGGQFNVSENVPAAADAQPTPYVDAATYADPAARQDLYNRALAPLSEAKTPEQKAEVEKTLVPQLTEQVKATAAPEQVKAVQAVAQNPESPQAQQAIEQGRSAFLQEQAGGDPTKLQDASFFGKALGMWNDLGPMGQMASMLGIPAVLIGLLSGDGLTGILGGLGIGALGIGAGAMGAFGEQTQNSINDGLFNLGRSAGLIPEVDPKDLALLKEQDPLAAMGRQAIGSREDVAAQLARVPGQIENLRKLQLLPESMRAGFMRRLDPSMTPEQAQLAVQNAAKILAAYDDPKSDLQTNITRGQNYAKSTGASGWLQENALVPLSNWLSGRNKTSAEEPHMNIAEKIFYQHVMTKAARCWAGYEPVPGKKPYSENSCRPIGSKKKKQTGKERHHETAKQGGAKG